MRTGRGYSPRTLVSNFIGLTTMPDRRCHVTQGSVQSLLVCCGCGIRQRRNRDRRGNEFTAGTRPERSNEIIIVLELEDDRVARPEPSGAQSGHDPLRA